MINNYTIMMKVLYLISSVLGSDIVLKGSVALNAALIEHDSRANIRMSEDFDLYIRCNFSNFLDNLDKILDTLNLTAVKVRTPKKHSGGRIDVRTHEEESLFFIDVDIDAYTHDVAMVKLEDTSLQRVTIEKICADKIDAVSKPKVLNRVKDIYDLYMISMVFDLEFSTIVSCFDDMHRSEASKNTALNGGLFRDFLDRAADLEVAYQLMDTLINAHEKPQFIQMYGRTVDFIRPFITKHLNSTNARWSCDRGSWIPYTGGLLASKGLSAVDDEFGSVDMGELRKF